MFTGRMRSFYVRGMSWTEFIFKLRGVLRILLVGTGKSLLLRFCSPLSLFGDIEFVQEVVVQSHTSASRTNLLGAVEERLASYLLTIQLQREFGKEIQTPYIPDIASLIDTPPPPFKPCHSAAHRQGDLI